MTAHRDEVRPPHRRARDGGFLQDQLRRLAWPARRRTRQARRQVRKKGPQELAGRAPGEPTLTRPGASRKSSAGKGAQQKRRKIAAGANQQAVRAIVDAHG
jgi:hypothetical protein